MGAMLLCLLVLAGCEDVSEFTTAPGESFCGAIVQGLSFRNGFGPGVRMRLNLDAEQLQQAPGILSTDDGLFVDTPLRPLPQLHHDALSTLQFGEGRVRNLMYGVQPTAGSMGYAVVSLLENGDVEVRILRGAPPMPGEPPLALDDPHLFGVFPLTRQRGTCGF
jgi:hypothetical protein